MTFLAELSIQTLGVLVEVLGALIAIAGAFFLFGLEKDELTYEKYSKFRTLIYLSFFVLLYNLMVMFVISQGPALETNWEMGYLTAFMLAFMLITILMAYLPGTLYGAFYKNK